MAAARDDDRDDRYGDTPALRAKSSDTSSDTSSETRCCVICREEIVGYGNNPAPLFTGEDLTACDECNRIAVVPARIVLATSHIPTDIDEETLRKILFNQFVKPIRLKRAMMNLKKEMIHQLINCIVHSMVLRTSQKVEDLLSTVRRSSKKLHGLSKDDLEEVLQKLSFHSAGNYKVVETSDGVRHFTRKAEYIVPIASIRRLIADEITEG